MATGKYNKKRIQKKYSEWIYKEFYASEDWIVPEKIGTIDAFVVGRGSNGSSSGMSRSSGGNGGSTNTYLGIPAVSGQVVTVFVESSYCYILNTSYMSPQGGGKSGGDPYTTRPGTDELVTLTRPGISGVLAFGDTAYSEDLFGASGGGGGMSYFEDENNFVHEGQEGGDDGGGNGGDLSHPIGFDGAFYGAGGGGGLFEQNVGGENAGGKGYQGCVIVRYNVEID